MTLFLSTVGANSNFTAIAIFGPDGKSRHDNLTLSIATPIGSLDGMGAPSPHFAVLNFLFFSNCGILRPFQEIIRKVSLNASQNLKEVHRFVIFQGEMLRGQLGCEK